MAKATKKPAVKKAESSAEISEKIQSKIDEIRQFSPHVKTAYINSKGDYHFHPRPGFNAYDIDANVDEDANVVEDDEPVDPVEPVTPAKAGDLGKVEF